MNVTPEKIPPHKMELPVIRKMPKTDHWISDSSHEVSDSNVSDQSHNKTVT